jgi:hypothetical protein
MAVLGWAMMGLAIWHFTIFLPDRFWGGIVGAFVGALLGAIAVGLLISGLSVPPRDDIDVLTILYAVPGALAGIAAVYAEGARRGITAP